MHLTTQLVTNFTIISSLAQKHAVSCPGPSLQRNFCVSNSLRGTRQVSTSSRRSSKPMQRCWERTASKPRVTPARPCEVVLHFATERHQTWETRDLTDSPAGLVLLLVDALATSMFFSRSSPNKAKAILFSDQVFVAGVKFGSIVRSSEDWPERQCVLEEAKL